MSLAAELKKAMFAAMKAKNTTEKEILRVAMGEITRTGEEPGDVEVQAVLRKIIKSNREALEVSTDAEQRAGLETEISVLERFLPRSLSVAEIKEALASVVDQIKAAPGPGPAMGVAMKVLKSAGAEAAAPDVTKAVTEIRS
jgi:uncharacterized protein YqeY